MTIIRPGKTANVKDQAPGIYKSMFMGTVYDNALFVRGYHFPACFTEYILLVFLCLRAVFLGNLTVYYKTIIEPLQRHERQVEPCISAGVLN